MIQTGHKQKEGVILSNGWSSSEGNPFDSLEGGSGHSALGDPGGVTLAPGQGNGAPPSTGFNLASDTSDMATLVSESPTVFHDQSQVMDKAHG